MPNLDANTIIAAAPVIVSAVWTVANLALQVRLGKILERERERNDALYQRRELCAAFRASGAHEDA